MRRPLIVKIADFLTSYFGTMTFLVSNIILYVGWVIVNTGLFPGIPVFDPYPYSFMNSFVSIEAIFLTVIVLMSQNRENERDVLRNELGLQVELISEKEITKILQLLKKLVEEKQKLVDPDLDQMTSEIDASYIEKKLQEQLSKSENMGVLPGPLGSLEEKFKSKIQ